MSQSTYEVKNGTVTAEETFKFFEALRLKKILSKYLTSETNAYNNVVSAVFRDEELDSSELSDLLKSNLSEVKQYTRAAETRGRNESFAYTSEEIENIGSECRWIVKEFYRRRQMKAPIQDIEKAFENGFASIVDLFCSKKFDAHQSDVVNWYLSAGKK